MKFSGDSTHPARALDPVQFRAQATGIGQRVSTSRITGGMRAQRVVDQTDPACLAAIPSAEGFPARTPDMPTQSVPYGVFVGPRMTR